MQWQGLAYAAGAAVGHSCIDVSRKMAAQHLNPAELIALVGMLDALLLCAIVAALGWSPSVGSWNDFFSVAVDSEIHLSRILIISAGLKVMAGYMYQKALHVSPMSVTVPYLAFTPVMLVFTSYVLMHESPSFRGLLGVLVVTVGGYLLVVVKHGSKTSKNINHLEDGTDHSFSLSMEENPKTVARLASFSNRISTSPFLEPLLALKREEGSILMLCVAGVFSISNSLDKMGTHLSPSPVLFAAVQRVIMAIPVLVNLLLVSPRSFTQLFHRFPMLITISAFEIVAFICYLKSLETLLVSYAIAAKRSNVLLSVIVGRIVFKEKIWKKLPYVILMVIGMILIILA